jgi:hypothetical protein
VLARFAAATLVTFAPAVALACPYCAGRANGGTGTLLTIAVFVSLPFFFAGAIYRVIRGYGGEVGPGIDRNSRRGLSLAPADSSADSSGSFPAYSASRRKA